MIDREMDGRYMIDRQKIDRQTDRQIEKGKEEEKKEQQELFQGGWLLWIPSETTCKVVQVSCYYLHITL